jgi:heterodisulfide reductase subunit C
MASGFKGPRNNIPRFHEIFLRQIRKKGRIDEGSLLLNYELKTGDFLSPEKFREEAGLGLELFRKGKIKLPSMRRHSSKTVKKIFRKVFSDV